MTQPTNNPFLYPFVDNQNSNKKPVNRGPLYFVTEKEYFEEGHNQKPNVTHKSIEHNGVTYYYTPNISDKDAQRLAETHPGGASQSVAMDPGGRKHWSGIYPNNVNITTTNNISPPDFQEMSALMFQGGPILSRNDSSKAVVRIGTEADLDNFDYTVGQLLDDKLVYGIGKVRTDNMFDPKKAKARSNYSSQVQNFEQAILNGITSDSTIYKKFEAAYPGVLEPMEYYLGEPIYRTDDEKNDYFYKMLFKYYQRHPSLAESRGVDIIGDSEDELTPTQMRIRVMNGVLNPKLKSSGIITNDNKAIINSLSPAGKVALLRSGYMSPLEIEKQVRNYVDNNELPVGGSQGGEFLKDIVVDLGITAAGYFTRNGKVAGYGAISTIADLWDHHYSVSAIRWSKKYRKATAHDARVDVQNWNQSVLDAVISADNEVKEALVTKDTEYFKDKYNLGLSQNLITEESIVKDFKTVAQYMPHYAGIVASGGDEFDNYPTERMIEDLSIFAATRRNLGDEAAFSVLDARFQNYVSDHQDGWDYFANTCLGFATEFVSNLGNTFLSIPTIPLGIIDAVSGNSYTADYLNSGANTYFQDIRQLNTFSPSEISAIKKAGGVSSYTNIRPVGEELKFWSPYTIGDVIEQGGQIASMTALGGSMNYGLGKIGRMGDRTRNFFVSATSALGGAHSEAAGTFQEAKEALTRTLDGAVEKKFEERRGYELTKYINSPQYVFDVNTKFEEYRKKADYYEWDDANLKKLAEEAARGEFLLNLRSSINNEYSEARNQISRYAEGAYFQSFILNGAKTTLTNTIVLKNVFHKPMLRPNTPVPGTYENNRLKLLTPTIKKYGMYGQRVGNVMLAEGLDEYFDGLFNDWATLTGNDTYSRYLAERWDMGAYMSNSSNWFSGLLTQGSKVYSNRFAPQYLFEGAIGAFSAGGVNVNPVYAYKALRGQSLLTDEELAHNLAITNDPNLTDKQKADMLIDLTVMEKAGRIFGGTMAAMAEVDTEFRNALIEGTAAAENITKYWEDFLGSTDLVSKLLAAKYSEGESMIDMKDAYDDLSLALATILVDSEDRLFENGVELQQLKDLKNLLLRAAEGDISDEDIDKFLSNPDNKAFLQSLGN